MIREIELEVSPETMSSNEWLRQNIRQQLVEAEGVPFEFQILRKSLDARKQPVRFVLRVQVFIREPLPEKHYGINEQWVQQGKEVHIIGAGPAGLFCALRCIESGLKPVLFERGKMVRERRRDLAILNKEGVLNEESNYCFGEGGAGTYSDGKLYTRSTKRGNVQWVLECLHAFGAGEEILYEAHPHIGTNKLPALIERIRMKILECGGEIYFEKKLTDINYSGNRVTQITLNENETVPVEHLVLATGHSAHDIYELLFRRKIAIESKPFALGVRVEHPQALIDQIQYHCTVRDSLLPPASYSLVNQVNERGVFSFCMCPGGIIAPASTRQGALVVNGWSPSKRNNVWANSGMVVTVDQRDFASEHPLAGLEYQYAIERRAFEQGGGLFKAPAQRISDFVTRSRSASLPACSYLPGVQSALLHDVLPENVYNALQKAFQYFNKRMKGFVSQEAVVVACESRTSSPVRIPRHKEFLYHPQLNNFYPCAEGAGYAGGIVSAALDGIRIAEQLK